MYINAILIKKSRPKAAFSYRKGRGWVYVQGFCFMPSHRHNTRMWLKVHDLV